MTGCFSGKREGHHTAPFEYTWRCAKHSSRRFRRVRVRLSRQAGGPIDDERDTVSRSQGEHEDDQTAQPIAQTNGAESLLAVVDGKMVDFRVPYPLGFNTKLVDGRIDDPGTGWKGKGLWTMSGTRTVFHNEGGTQNRPKVYKIQIRPDPLAN